MSKARRHADRKGYADTPWACGEGPAERFEEVASEVALSRGSLGRSGGCGGTLGSPGGTGDAVHEDASRGAIAECRMRLVNELHGPGESVEHVGVRRVQYVDHENARFGSAGGLRGRIFVKGAYPAFRSSERPKRRFWRRLRQNESTFML